MAADGWEPEIVIGVDFGMTCTGKALESCRECVTLLRTAF